MCRGGFGVRRWCCFLLLWIGGGAAAAEQAVAPQPLSIGVEAFVWEEFYAGERLLREQGPRLLLGLERDNLQRRWPGLVYRARVRGHLARVAYRGRSQDAAGVSYPLNTVTDYLGGGARLLLGQRLGYLPDGRFLDLYLGLEGRLWLRDIRGAVDEGGRYAVGYRELYRLLAVQAAVGLGRAERGGAGLVIGASYPLRVVEWVSLGGRTLRPRGRLGGWLAFRLPPWHGVSLSLEVDWLDLGASPAVEGYFQPDSRALRLGAVFSWRG